MSQFRTITDIKTEVLQKAGEPTNGNSSYETLALTYLNKAHHALIAGGSIFNLIVDEAWTWARSKYPMILELQPAYITGTITATEGSRTITFSDAPASSLQYWYVQFQQDATVYRIAQHTAASTSATLDSAFLDSSGTYNFKVMKLDYTLAPTYIVIDSSNDKLDLIEAGTTEQTISLTHGAYTPPELIAHVVTLLNALIGTVTYTGTYDTIARTFTLTSDLNGGAVFKLTGATGTNRRRSTLPSLGFDRLDYTGAATYTSAYIVGGISRLIEPFKVYKQKCKDPFIYSNDPINMELDYPLWCIREAFPTMFCKVGESNEGTVTVRFNSYPKEKMRVEINWIPVPIDLQDNTASYPLIPRKDIDILIHMATAMILFDKEDSKFTDTLKLAGDGLTMMMKKNRSEMRRTDRNFGQIIPREDYIYTARRALRYGYDVESN